MTTSTTKLKPATFAPPTTFSVGTNPWKISIGDFDNDGNADIAVLNLTIDNINTSLLSGDGRGNFSTQTVTSDVYGNDVYALIHGVGDFNDDGKIDHAKNNHSNHSVSLSLGDGHGRFFDIPRTFSVGSNADNISTGDFNKDGKTDLATSNTGDNTVSLLLGDGYGSFDAQTTFVVGDTPYSVRVSDFNNDGNADLVTANGRDGNVSILLGDGRGSFSAQTTFAVGGTYTFPSCVNVGDFNGDGNVDLITANTSDHNVSVLLGDGSGSFGQPTIFAVAGYAVSVNVGDFNSDGKVDLVVVNSDLNSISLLLNTTDGKFVASSNPIAPPTYSLTVDRSTVNEGETVYFRLATTKVAEGTEIPFALSGTISNADALGGLPIPTFYVEADGSATVAVGLQNDNLTEGNETLTATLSNDKSKTAPVTVKDTSLTPPPPVNHAPTGSVLISGTAIQGETLSLQNTLKDADGLGAFSISWLKNGAPISGATQNSYTLTDSDIGKVIKVKVSYTDGLKKVETVTSGATDVVQPLPKVVEPDPVEIVNHKPTGAIKITGVATENQILTLTNTLKDADELGDLNYSWWRDGKIISGANQNSYTLTSSDVGKKISANVSYTDGANFAESVTSGATAKITAAKSTSINPPPSKISGYTFDGTPNDDKRTGAENDDFFTGAAGADIFNGKAGNDTLDGGTGADLLDGAEGNDVLIGGDGKDTLIGGSGDDKLSGGKDNDLLTGDKGNDTLNGNEGVDTMEGGDGNDYYFVDNLKDSVKETNKIMTLGGNDTIESVLTWTLGDFVENLILTGLSDLNGTGNKDDNRIQGNIANNVLNGNAGNDYLLGGDGDDTLDGGLGMDTLEGGKGSDTYLMNNTQDQIIETPNQEDQDQIIATVNYDLSRSPNVEILTLKGKSAIEGTGNDLNNALQENDGGNVANKFDGMGGDDTINGEGGDDTLIGGDGNDDLDGGAGNDTAIFDNAYEDYQITRNVDAVGVDQIVVEFITFGSPKLGEKDILTNIELLQFADGDINNIRVETIPITTAESNTMLILTGIDTL